MSDCINGFSEEEIAGLLTLAQQGDKDAASKLVDMALPIVEAQAKSFSGNGFEFADLSQEGMITRTQAQASKPISISVLKTGFFP